MSTFSGKESTIPGKQVNLCSKQSQLNPYRNGIVNYESKNRVNLFRKRLIHSEQPTKRTSLHASEEETKEAILALLEATDDDGKKIFTEKSQWYAVYKVLSECHGYPTNIREFCDIMKNWGMDEVSPACSYNSVRRIPSDISKSTTKVALWNNYKSKADEKFKKQIIVANQLMEMLEK